MSAPDPAPDVSLSDEHTPDDLVEIGFYRSSREGFDHGLVVLALGLPYWLIPSADGYRLLVEPATAGHVRAQLVRFERESIGWPPAPSGPGTPAARVDLVTPLLWAWVVIAVFREELRRPEWIERGALDARAVFGGGEGWRAFTALFLHADAEHLASNLLGGYLVFAALLSTFGRVRGWLLVAAAAVTGNLAVAAAHHAGPYRSIGASTAIFAAVGLMTGRAVRIALGSEYPHRWRAFFVPFATGLIVLGLFGAGDPHTDVAAHAAGFIAGLVGGFVAEQSRRSVPERDATAG